MKKSMLQVVDYGICTDLRGEGERESTRSTIAAEMSAAGLLDLSKQQFFFMSLCCGILLPRVKYYMVCLRWTCTSGYNAS